MCVFEVGVFDVWWLMSYGGGLFVFVKDVLKGCCGGMYGGGCYLFDMIKGVDFGLDFVVGIFVFDFNFVYNLSCVYDLVWVCLLVFVGNMVVVDILVGELYFGSY